MINRDDGDENCRDVHDGSFRRLQLFIAHRNFARGEVADATGDVFDALHSAGAEITDLHAGAELVIFLDPVRVEWGGKI